MVSAHPTHLVESTPALVIDLPIVQSNIDRLAAYAREHRIGLRPHTKTHKSIEMARRQIAAGAIGLTAAKVGEAELMAQAADDLLVAYPVVDEFRCRHLAQLAQTGKTVRVAADSLEGIDALAAAAKQAGSTLGVLIDLDIGFHRTGAPTPQAALQLAQRVAREPSLRVDGIFFYPGHVWLPANEQPPELARIDALLAETIDLWKHSGFEAHIVSGGSTPTAYQSHYISRQTEIRPGTYIYNDMNTARAGFCSLDECAAVIVCTIVSTSVAGKAVIDGGTKTFTSDRNIKFPDSGHGHVVEFPDAVLTRLSEEHGELDISRCAQKPRIGQRIAVIPNHICPCVNLQDKVWVRDDAGVLQRWRVDARGRLS
jgi:D-serine deaminase-like pyridoxal phosphate-dependent protein